jgi:hypothetical protein
MMPTFITGANAKIKVAGSTLAYCTDLSYTVEVNHVVPRVLGMYEGVSVEPVSYGVAGSFSVIRYARKFKELTKSARDSGFLGSNPIPPISDRGNGIGAMYKPGASPDKERRAFDNLDPSTFEAGNSFVIEVYQKIPKSLYLQQTRQRQYTGAGIINTTNATVESDGVELVPVARIRNARISRVDASLSKSSAMIERFSFIALYLDEDSFIAYPSGSAGSGNRYELAELGKSGR